MKNVDETNPNWYQFSTSKWNSIIFQVSLLHVVNVPYTVLRSTEPANIGDINANMKTILSKKMENKVRVFFLNLKNDHYFNLIIINSMELTDWWYIFLGERYKDASSTRFIRIVSQWQHQHIYWLIYRVRILSLKVPISKRKNM